MDNGIDMFLTSLKFIYYHHFIDVMWMTELLGFWLKSKLKAAAMVINPF